MSTRKQTSPNFLPMGSSIDPDLNLPSCTIEDVDRAIFNLFDKDLDLIYKEKKTTRKVPIIFATGERFAVLRRKQPLRDKAGAIILPLISLQRTGIDQTPSKGAATNQSAPITIKKKLSPKDSAYQQILNKERLKNSDERATPNHELATKETKGGQGRGAKPGTVATRRKQLNKKIDFSSGRLISDSIANNIYEIYTIEPPKYYVATYEITVWAQYTQQMNHLLTAIMSSYHSFGQRVYRIETEKGYFFSAYFAANISTNNNFDDFTDSERIVRNTFTVEVPGYIVNPDYPGATPTHRRYISAPSISFDMTQVNSVPDKILVEGIPSGDPNDYILQDVKTKDDPRVARITGGKAAVPGNYYKNTSVGGSQAGNTPITVKRVEIDPVTGQTIKKQLTVSTRIQRKGETVYKELITHDLGNLVIEPE
jgi:hypothetical protein